jgi:MFS family permease
MLTPRQLRRNAILHMLDGVFFMIAMAVFSREIVIPTLIKELTGSMFLLGLRPTIVWVGMLLPQLWYVRHIEGLPYKKPTVLLWAVVERIGWVLFMLWISFFWGNSGQTLAVFYITLAIGSLGSGMVMPVWSDWLAKTTPEESWGWVRGVCWAVPALFIVIAGPLFKRTMNFDSPLDYQILLGVAIVFWIMSFAAVALVREDHELEPASGERSSWRVYLKRMAWISFRRRDFRLFMLTNVLSHVPLILVITFMTRYALTIEGVAQSDTSRFTSYYFGFLALGALAGGRISDRFGPTVPCRIYPLLTAAACSVACFWRSADAVVWIYGLWGVASGLWSVSNLPILFRYAGPARRPIYTAVSMTILGVTGASAPPIVGWIHDRGLVSFNTLFLVAGAMALCSWALFMLRIPRWPIAEEHAVNNSKGARPAADAGTPQAPGRGD